MAGLCGKLSQTTRSPPMAIRNGLNRVLLSAQQATGINAVMFYAPKFLALGGVQLKMLGSVAVSGEAPANEMNTPFDRTCLKQIRRL